MFTEEIDSTQKCYVLWIEGNESIKVHQTSVAVSKLLSEKGFVFCSANTSGGGDDVYHTGTKSYSVKYNDFSSFENNFFSDYDDAVSKEYAETGGWVSFLEYREISVYLKKTDVRIWVMISEDKRALIRVYEFDDSFDVNSLVDEVKALLPNPVTVEEIPQYVDETSEMIEKHFLHFWENENTK